MHRDWFAQRGDLFNGVKVVHMMGRQSCDGGKFRHVVGEQVRYLKATPVFHVAFVYVCMYVCIRPRQPKLV